MSSLGSAVVGGPRAGQARRAPSRIWAVYGALGFVLFCYVVLLIVRSPDQHSTLLDGWSVDLFEVVVFGLAVGRAVTRRTGRAVPLALAAAMLMWTLGDIALTFESLGGASPSSPSVADGFYLAFFPVAYLALVLMVRRESSKLVPATWLDGAVAGLGAAALCATFAFHSIEQLAGGGAATVATNLAYPLGDVLLLAMVVGGTALLSGSRRGSWHLVAAGCLLNAVGDTFNLFESLGPRHLGAVADGIAWPAALLLMSMAAWVRPARRDPLAHQATPGFLLPGIGAASALVVLLTASVHRIDAVAVALAASTLAVVGVRLTLSLGSLRKLTEERHFLSVTDQLTGLGNRRQLADVLDGFFADSDEPGEQRTLTFLFVDLDQFKEVNDSFGHTAGDQLLTQIGPRITGCLTSSALLTRIGGDELAVILFDADVDDVTRIAEQLSAAIREPFVLDMVSVQIGASIGIAIAPDHASNAADLMRHADQAMYRAKHTGTSFEIYDPALDSETDRLRLLEDLRTAIDEQQLELHYQPQIDLRNGTVTALEALLRWSHPRLGFIPPLEFLPLAEEAGLMRPLTKIVLDQALGQCAHWRAEGLQVSVSVNVSATNVQDTEFTTLVADQLERHAVPADALVLEITETTVIGDFDRCKSVIDKLRELGCVVSIDDFGAGFTSLAHLGRLAVGELKLDRTFLAPLVHDQPNVTLVRAMIELAHALGLHVVAEGVEEKATLDILIELGCDLAQGYYIAKPAPAAALSLRTAQLAA